jgi:hypothetical protein
VTVLAGTGAPAVGVNEFQFCFHQIAQTVAAIGPGNTWKPGTKSQRALGEPNRSEGRKSNRYLIS